MVVGLTCGWVSCVSPHATQTKTDQAQTAPAAVHAVHDQRLREIMKTLSTQLPTYWPQEIEQQRNRAVRRSRLRSYSECIDAAERLRQSTTSLIDWAGDADFTESERAEFITLAERIAHESATLIRAAHHRQDEMMSTALADINAACTACHARFRIEPEDVARR